jgi:hypothetical protein
VTLSVGRSSSEKQRRKKCGAAQTERGCFAKARHGFVNRQEPKRLSAIAELVAGPKTSFGS